MSNGDNILTIDLHKSSGISEAEEQFEKELYYYAKNKEKYVKVVYGVGEGILKKVIIELIKKHPLVYDYYIGDDGFCIVEL